VQVCEALDPRVAEGARVDFIEDLAPNEKIEDALGKLMDDYVGEDEWTGGYHESSDKPYDRFMVKFKQSGEDTEEISEEIIKELNDKFESNLFKVGNSSKNSFWFYVK
jgi:hypothetical protein